MTITFGGVAIRQIERLADYLHMHMPGECQSEEPVVDTVIRMLEARRDPVPAGEEAPSTAEWHQVGWWRTHPSTAKIEFHYRHWGTPPGGGWKAVYEHC